MRKKLAENISVSAVVVFTLDICFNVCFNSPSLLHQLCKSGATERDRHVYKYNIVVWRRRRRRRQRMSLTPNMCGVLVPDDNDDDDDGGSLALSDRSIPHRIIYTIHLNYEWIFGYLLIIDSEHLALVSSSLRSFLAARRNAIIARATNYYHVWKCV